MRFSACVVVLCGSPSAPPPPLASPPPAFGLVRGPTITAAARDAFFSVGADWQACSIRIRRVTSEKQKKREGVG